jgi:hypothetical protein
VQQKFTLRSWEEDLNGEGMKRFYRGPFQFISVLPSVETERSDENFSENSR